LNVCGSFFVPFFLFRFVPSGGWYFGVRGRETLEEGLGRVFAWFLYGGKGEGWDAITDGWLDNVVGRVAVGTGFLDGRL
jgi:hypothetical protein